MKVAVLGAGAIGSMLGGLIKQHAPETDVVLIARGPHGQAMKDQGHVVLHGDFGTYRPPVTVSFDAEDVAGCDYLLLTVKSQATSSAVQSALPHLGNAVVVSIQNGLNQEQLLEHLPPERIVMGLTATNMVIEQPGSVTLQLDGASIVGPAQPGPLGEAATGAHRMLQKSGLRFDAQPDVLGYQCNKLAINAIGYAACLSDSNLVSQALVHPHWRKKVGLPILMECLETYQRAGIQLHAIPGAPTAERIRWFTRRLERPVMGAILSWGVRRFFRKPIKFSLGRDLAQGKSTEVDFINGQIVNLARRHSAEAPANAQVVKLVHKLEERGDGSFFTIDEVVERF